MLTISKKQMKTLGDHMLQVFKDRMAIHLRRTFPIELEETDDDDLREMIEGGIEKAQAYGITMEKDVQIYLEYMVQYSPDFDTNPETAWAGDILSEKEVVGALKIIRLKQHEDKTRGIG